MNRPLAAVAASLLFALTFASPDLHTAHAAAPMVKTQAPGYHRVLVGDFEVTALLDATSRLPVLNLLTDAPKEQLTEALQKGFVGETVETSVNAYLVNTGSKLVLIDTGSGSVFGDKPALLDNLRAAGYRPEQVDEVYITHMHGDHVGGLMAGSALAFPNAVLRLHKADADFWLSEAVMNRAPKEVHQFFKAAMTSVNPYVAAGKLKTFAGTTELVPGISAVPAQGHTPGHTIYRIESKGSTLVLWGDLMHVAAVQFQNPKVAITFDIDSKAAVQERLRAFAEAAEKRWMVGAAHLSFPGLGHLLPATGGGYTFVPLNYSMLKE